MNPWAFFALSFGTLIGTLAVDIHTSPFLKHALWISFMSTMALGLVPLINMASMPIIYDALFATGFTMGGLGLVAYNSPNEQFLQWGGLLGMACAGLIGLSFVQLFWPSQALFNFWLYSGLALFSAFTIYDVQKLVFKAKTHPHWDPISESLGLYLDALNIFQRFVLIFMQNKNKRQ
jgi:FtsH-binding integral membrane protein